MDKYLNAQEVMEMLRVGRSTVYALLNRRDFPAVRIGKRLIVSETALQEWMRRGGTAQDTGEAQQ